MKRVVHSLLACVSAAALVACATPPKPMVSTPPLSGLCASSDLLATLDKGERLAENWNRQIVDVYGKESALHTSVRPVDAKGELLTAEEKAARGAVLSDARTIAKSVRGMELKPCLQTRDKALDRLEEAFDFDRRAWRKRWQPLEQATGGLSAPSVRALQFQWAEALRWKIMTRWLRPPGLPSNLVATAHIDLLPDGGVVSVKVTASSGNPSFDESLILASYKMITAPMPFAASVFNRALEPTFMPEPS